jgi:NAD(P)-dependent dehydrogenase (short-subunit alcohol dehydrogenase family)
MDLQLTDKVVLVTGSSRGAGRAAAVLFGAQGARVAVNYHAGKAGAEETAALVEQAGVRALIVQGDVTSRASLEALAATVAAQWAPIQVLVNNAVAFDPETPLEALTDAQTTALFDVVVQGAIHAAATCAPGMKAAGWGRIVNVTSRSAIMGSARMAHYAAAKSALVGLTRAWAKELGPAGILVNAVAPTLIMTDKMLESMSKEAQERLAKTNPLRRLATPDDIARVVVYLGSGWNTYVNGEIITVGGGVMS